MLKGYAPEDIEDNYNKYTSSQEADKCFEVNNTEKNGKSNINADLEIASTQHSRARLIIEKKQISHNLELGVFTVVGTTGKPHAIRLFPKESCTCPATSTCSHILAVRMSIGLEGSSQKKINLTQLRHNTRSRAERKSGRKAPRPGDYQVNSAPDSVQNEEELSLLSDDNDLDDCKTPSTNDIIITSPAKSGSKQLISSQIGKKRKKCSVAESVASARTRQILVEEICNLCRLTFQQ